MDLVKKGKINVFKKLLEIFYANHHTIENFEEFDGKKLILLNVKFWAPSVFVQLIPMTGIFGYWYVAIQNYSTSDQIDSVTILLGFFMANSIMFIGLLNAKEFIICVERLSNHSFGKPPNWDKLCKQIDVLSILLYHGIRWLQVVNVLLMYFGSPYCTGRENREDDRYICGSVFPQWYPFKVDSKLMNIGICLIAGLSFILYLPVFALYPAVVYGSVAFTVLKIRHLRRMLRKIIKKSNKESLEDDLWICMKYHSHIAELTGILSNFLGPALFPLYVLMPIVTALFAYQTIEVSCSVCLVEVQRSYDNIEKSLPFSI
ncbi:hypothetical protein HHI36_002119 [Cryptolaemus montrouzieri]|uniref:Odorant receptor n=1 Tax=Cryptolaemus montrouzieri TaxID=559131 RepID=A0ABD2PAE5_9CUCU